MSLRPGTPQRLDSHVWETYKALPTNERAYTDYDFSIINDILVLAEQQAEDAAKKGKGTGDLTLQKVLIAYEKVLPRYQVKPQEDVYYYRLLLKLSLDPEQNWWAKLHNEVHGSSKHGTGSPVAAPASPSRSPPHSPARSPPRPRSLGPTAGLAAQSRLRDRHSHNSGSNGTHTPSHRPSSPRPSRGRLFSSSGASVLDSVAGTPGQQLPLPGLRVRPPGSGQVGSINRYHTSSVISPSTASLPRSQRPSFSTGVTADPVTLHWPAPAAQQQPQPQQPPPHSQVRQRLSQSLPQLPQQVQSEGQPSLTLLADGQTSQSAQQLSGQEPLAARLSGLPSQQYRQTRPSWPDLSQSLDSQELAELELPAPHQAQSDDAVLLPQPSFSLHQPQSGSVQALPGQQPKLSSQPLPPAGSLMLQTSQPVMQQQQHQQQQQQREEEQEADRKAEEQLLADALSIPSPTASQFSLDGPCIPDPREQASMQPRSSGTLPIANPLQPSAAAQHMPCAAAASGDVQRPPISASYSMPKAAPLPVQSQVLGSSLTRPAPLGLAPASASPSTLSYPAFLYSPPQPLQQTMQPGIPLPAMPTSSASVMYPAGMPGLQATQLLPSFSAGSQLPQAGPVWLRSQAFSTPTGLPNAVTGYMGTDIPVWPAAGLPSSLATTPAAAGPAPSMVQQPEQQRAPERVQVPPSPIPGTLRPRRQHTTGQRFAAVDSDDEDSAQDEFKLVLGCFRTWRGAVQQAHAACAVREGAVENWLIAVSYWEVALARRCLRRWAEHRQLLQEQRGRAIALWKAAGTAMYFQRWQEGVKQLRVVALMSGQHSRQRTMARCFRAWQQYLTMTVAKAAAGARAMAFWMGHSTKVCFVAWQQLTAKSLKQGEHAAEHHRFAARRVLLLLWKKAARRLKELRVAGQAITKAQSSRLVSAAVRSWQVQLQLQQRYTQVVARAAGRMRNRFLAAAFASLRQNVAQAQLEGQAMRKALSFFSNGTLARSWNSWQQAVAVARGKQAAVKHALGFWLHQRLSRAWGSWQQLVVMAHDNHALAMDQAARVLARQLKGLWVEWRQWLVRHQAKAQLAAQHAQRIQAGVAVRCVQAWRASVSQRQANLKAFDQIIAMEVTRLKYLACRRLLSASLLLAKQLDAEAAVARNRGARIVIHWQALARFKHHRRDRRDLALRSASSIRRRRLLQAWLVAATIRADHRHVLSVARVAANRRTAAAVLSALREAAARGITKKTRGMEALLHWEVQHKARALAGWCARTQHWKLKSAAQRRAHTHRSTRLLGAALIGWLGQWVQHQDKCAAAVLLLSSRQSARRALILREWRRVTETLSMQHDGVRRALAHWIASRLGTAFYAWQVLATARQQLHSKLQTALVFWLTTNMARVFTCWRSHVAYKAEVWQKTAVYLAVVNERRAFHALAMLHAHLHRKRKTRDARHGWSQRVLRTVLLGWLTRVGATEDLQTRLALVYRQVCGNLMAQSFQGWRDYLQYVYNKRILAVRALYFWMTCRLRMAFSALRWYALHKQMGSTLALKHSITVLQRALAAWRAEAVYLQDLRMRCIRLITRSQYQVLADAWSCWVEWLELKRSGDLQHSRAVAFLSHFLLGKAWNSWRAHHALHVTAQRVMRHMLNRALAVAMNAWWQAVLHHREVMLCCEQFMVRLANQGLAKGMDAFKYHHERRQRKRLADSHFFTKKAKEVLLAWRLTAKLSLALALWTGNLLGLAFSQWSQACRRQQHLRITALTVAQRWSHLGLNQAWQSWRAFAGWRVGLKAAATAVVAKIANKALLAAWNSWLEFMYLQAIKHRALTTFTQRALARAWNTWVAATFDKGGAIAQAQAMFLRATARMAATSLSAVFQSWRSYAARMTRLRLLLERALGRHLELALRGWRSVTAEKQQQRRWQAQVDAALHHNTILANTCHAAVRRWSLLPLCCAFEAWLSSTQQAQYMRQATATAVFAYFGGLAHKAFTAWLLHTGESRQQEQRHNAILQCLHTYRLRRIFAFWAALAPYLRHMKGAMQAIHSRQASRTQRSAWASWRYFAHFSHLARSVLARLASRLKLEALRQWRAAAVLQASRRAKVQSVLHRLLHRTLSCAFNGWLSHAQQSRRLGLSAAAVVARLRNQALYAAWRSWQELVQEQHEVAEKIATALGHWGNGRLARAFNQWLDYWQHRTLETVADVHYFGRLLDTAWLAWHRVASDSVATRGVEANKMLTSRRALDCWRQFAQEAQRHKALPDMLAALVAVRTLQDWRMLTKAHALMRALRQRRALAGWYNRVLHLQQQRLRLQQASLVSRYSVLARVFRGWLGFVRGQNLKRTVFAQKQATIKEALRVGEQIRQRRNGDLLEAAYYAWQRRASIQRQAAQHAAALQHRKLISLVGVWLEAARASALAAAKADAHWRRVTLDHYLSAWSAAAASLAKQSTRLMNSAQRHWYRHCMRAVLTTWVHLGQLGTQRQDALLRVFETQVVQERKWLLVSAWEALLVNLHQRRRQQAAANLAAASRRRQVKLEVFTVWLQYATAMQGKADQSSPFASPRSQHGDRRLIRRTAALMGSCEVDAGSDMSEDVFGDIYRQGHPTMAAWSTPSRRAKQGALTSLAIPEAEAVLDATSGRLDQRYTSDLDFGLDTWPGRDTSIAGSPDGPTRLGGLPSATPLMTTARAGPRPPSISSWAAMPAHDAGRLELRAAAKAELQRTAGAGKAVGLALTSQPAPTPAPFKAMSTGFTPTFHKPSTYQSQPVGPQQLPGTPLLRGWRPQEVQPTTLDPGMQGQLLTAGQSSILARSLQRAAGNPPLGGGLQGGASQIRALGSPGTGWQPAGSRTGGSSTDSSIY